MSKGRPWQVVRPDTCFPSTNLTLPPSSTSLIIVGDVSSTCSSSSNIDSSSVNSNNRVSSAIGVGSSSVGSSLSNPGMGNPFARAAIHASWGSTESCEQRPILAPSRLSSHTDSGMPCLPTWLSVPLTCMTSLSTFKSPLL